MIKVPDVFAKTTINREGEAGHRWIAELPGRVERLCNDWDLAVDGSPIPGYFGLIIPVRRGGNAHNNNKEEACVLKLSWINESTAAEAKALACWQGQGAVHLLASHPSLGAMLLERLDHRRSLADIDIDQAVVIAGRLLRRLAIPAPAGFRSQETIVAEIVQRLDERWERYGRPMPQSWLDQAREFAAQFDRPTESLLVNTDLHYENVLAGQREPWLVVDPKAVSGDLEFGPAQLLWCRLEDMEAGKGLVYYFQALIEAAELEPDLARAWAIVRCVDYWLWALSAGLTIDPARCEIVVGQLI